MVNRSNYPDYMMGMYCIIPNYQKPGLKSSRKKLVRKDELKSSRDSESIN